MKKLRFVVIAVLAIVGLVSVSCSQDNDAIQAPQEQAQEFQLPEVINIVPLHQVNGVVTRGVTTYSNVTAYDVAGEYLGKLSNVYMKGKKKDDTPEKSVSVEINATAQNKFDFVMNPFSVGRMPGFLDVAVDDLTLNSDGSFSALNKGTVHLQLFANEDGEGGLDRYYDVTTISGNFEPTAGGYYLNLNLKCEKSWWKLKIFTASVDFDGNRK
ncbi:MAG: hypothetical protein KGV44_13875 [Flavobacteriaceae bacterium]|nr:hypothetical protein [Flavobacteriaceae bacterium]